MPARNAKGAVIRLAAEGTTPRRRRESHEGTDPHPRSDAHNRGIVSSRKNTAMSGLIFGWSSGKRVDDTLDTLLVLPFCRATD